jgi:hypothetical protein
MRSVLFGRWKFVSSRSTTRKAKPGRDEERRLAAARGERRPRRCGGRRERLRFERAQARRADRDDATAARPRPRDRRDRVGADPVALAVHDVRRQVDAPHGLERARADVQRDRAAFDAARLDRREQRGVEVQRRGRRCDGARLGGEHGLVATLVVGPVVAGDVRRQRHVAVPLEQDQRIVGKAQREERSVGAAASEHLDLETFAGAQADATARLRRLARAQLREDAVVRLDPLDERLDGAAARLGAEQARLDDARVVDDEQVAFAQQPRQVAEDEVARPGAGAVEQARGAPLGGRMLRDQLGRQREIEVAERVAREEKEGIVIDRWPAGKILPCPLPRPSAPGRRRAARSRGRQGARKARPGARHRSGAAPAAALRGRDDGDPDRRAARRRDGQVEAVVSDSKIQFRPRRQLVVTLKDEHGDDLVLRFLHFYPSTQKTLAVGKRVRARGDARGGFFGLEMVHPSFKVVAPGAPLPTSLTPVYPSTVQLSQAVLRKAVAGGLARADLDEIVPQALMPPALPSLREALAACTSRRRGSMPGRSRTGRIRRGSASSSTSCWRSSCRSCRPSASGRRNAHRPSRRSAAAATTRCCATCRSSSPRRSGASSPRSAPTWHGRCRCTACCRATSARARP